MTDRNATLRHLVETDNRVFDGVEGVTKALHICRGNDRSHFTGTEPYDEFAAAIFPHTAADRLLLEYDDERSGGFAPLRSARDDQTVVLGLVDDQALGHGERRRAQAADRGGEPLRAARAARAVHAVRVRLQRRGQRDHLRRAARASSSSSCEVATDVWGHA